MYDRWWVYTNCFMVVLGRSPFDIDNLFKVITFGAVVLKPDTSDHSFYCVMPFHDHSGGGGHLRWYTVLHKT